MCEQEHVSLSNAFLHNSAARAKHMRMHVGLYLSDLRCVVIGQYTMGAELMDRSINFVPLLVQIRLYINRGQFLQWQSVAMGDHTYNTMTVSHELIQRCCV